MHATGHKRHQPTAKPQHGGDDLKPTAADDARPRRSLARSLLASRAHPALLRISCRYLPLLQQLPRDSGRTPPSSDCSSCQALCTLAEFQPPAKHVSVQHVLSCVWAGASWYLNRQCSCQGLCYSFLRAVHSMLESSCCLQCRARRDDGPARKTGPRLRASRRSHCSGRRPQVQRCAPCRTA